MVPRRVRPKFPSEWHVPNDPKLFITWAHARDKLSKETVYWISTASSDRHPHAAPVWGIWKNNRFYFETDPKSPKARNLLNNGSLVFHLQDGMDTVIVQASTRRETNSRVLNELKKDYVKKYRYKPDWSNERNQIVFRAHPKVVHAWKAPKMHRSVVKFLF